jgi:hypothetical protein
LCGHFATKGIWVYVVHKGPLAVDLHDREPLPVARLQPGIAVDLDLLELEGGLLPNLGDDPPSALAQVARRCVIQDDFRDRSRA